MISSILTPLSIMEAPQLLALWLWILAVPIVVVVVLAIYNIYLHPLRKVPGPKYLSANRVAYTRMMSGGEPHKKIFQLHQAYGDIVRISPNEVSVIGETAWDDLMGHRKYGSLENGKDPHFYTLSKNSVIGANREDHARMRRTLAHGFSAATIEKQEGIITSYVDRLLEQLRYRTDDGKAAIDVVAWYNWTTFDIIGDLTLGQGFDGVEKAEWHPIVSHIFARLKGVAFIRISGHWGWLSGVIKYILGREVFKGTKAYADAVKERLQQRAEFEAERPDYYQAMAAPEDARKQEFSPAELLQTSSTLLVAGSETTATALSGVTYLLTQNPEVLAKLAHEVRTAFNDESEINLRSVQNLNYMLAVLNEGLRMYPPVPMAIPRQINAEGAVVSGHWIPKGTIVGIPQYAAYHNPDYYHMPESFVPERWQGDERFAGDRNKVFQPFSFGPRNCIGRNLAYAEMRLILARIVWNFDIRLNEESENWVDKNEVYNLWHKPGLKVHLTPVTHTQST